MRFPGFVGEWEEKKLEGLLEFKNGLNAKKEQYGKGVKFINVLDILNNEYITYDKIVGSVDIDDATVNNYLVNFGDILFQRSSETREEVGSACVYLDRNRPAIFGGFVIRGKKIGEYNPIFLNKLLKTSLSRDLITSKSGGSTRYNVGQDILSSIILPFPSLPEQQKIADFLTAVDARIQQLTRKKELLAEYKKGVMQKIFSQEIRFKDENGKDFPEWEEKKLGNYIDEYKKNSDKNDEYEVFTSSNKGLMRQSEYYGENRITERDNVGFNIIPPGYITYRSRSDNRRFTFNINNLGVIGIISTYYPVFQIINGNNKFFIEFANFYQHIFGKYSVGTSQQVLSLNDLRSIKFKLPCSHEQQKIADFLTEIDNKIDQFGQQLEKMQSWKKGLLQQMFV
ncbi:MAG: restriction endonuclease subunit S [Candidatus Margulisiibacteriota bacterium]|nr:MAG: restriction endonuclease subunit S [Candidatus Margulisiibacteriota bacterium]